MRYLRSRHWVKAHSTFPVATPRRSLIGMDPRVRRCRHRRGSRPEAPIRSASPSVVRSARIKLESCGRDVRSTAAPDSTRPSAIERPHRAVRHTKSCLTVRSERLSLRYVAPLGRGQPDSEGHQGPRVDRPNMNSQEYRRWRHRRRAAWVDASRTRRHRDTEANHLIEFASMWAPHGGASEEAILVHFGMSKPRFIERLWQLLPESNCAGEEIRTLASAYPHHRTSRF